jgi:hypothetical protein
MPVSSSEIRFLSPGLDFLRFEDLPSRFLPPPERFLRLQYFADRSSFSVTRWVCRPSFSLAPGFCSGFPIRASLPLTQASVSSPAKTRASAPARFSAESPFLLAPGARCRSYLVFVLLDVSGLAPKCAGWFLLQMFGAGMWFSLA